LGGGFVSMARGLEPVENLIARDEAVDESGFRLMVV
jgi:hypothetical protein